MSSFLQNTLRRSAFSLSGGILAGVAATLFLVLLDIATRFRDDKPEIIWLLPVAGFGMGWIYHHYGGEVAGGTNLILEEIHDPKQVVPIRLAPLILFSTVVTHLFGGSAGREGTVVQMGASLSDQLARIFRLGPEERRVLLVAGAGAGFGAALGTPWAGIIFGMEFIRVGRFKLFAVWECILASFAAYSVTRLLRSPHTHYALGALPTFTFEALLWVAIAGVCFGFTARAFTFLVHWVGQIHSKWVSYPPLRPALGGALLAALFALEASYRYVGLGLPLIQEALSSPGSFKDALLKGVFTAITVGSGFKGGEFIPLVFIGTTLGSALSVLLPVSFQILAGVGFAAVFAGAANTPIACIVMAAELFGLGIAPYALVGCLVSYLVSSEIGIYRSQKIQGRKFSFRKNAINLKH